MSTGMNMAKQAIHDKLASPSAALDTKTNKTERRTRLRVIVILRERCQSLPTRYGHVGRSEEPVDR
jgi:hypothetical protein